MSPVIEKSIDIIMINVLLGIEWNTFYLIILISYSIITSLTSQPMNYNHLPGANLCIQQSVKLMRKLGIEQGQIININSNFGHRVYSAPGMRYV